MNPIIPAILPKSQKELNDKAKSVADLVTHVQVDVCDGIFVPSRTDFQELPLIDQVEYELDLMIDRPEDSIQDYIDMQPARIIVHLESVRDDAKLFLQLEKVRETIEVGLSIGNDTPNSLIERYIDDCEFIQLMGISNIGYQGQAFDERVIEKIRFFKEHHSEVPIVVDGSVNAGTIGKLAKAGASRFVCGSSVFDGDVAKNIAKLESLVQ